MDRGIALVLTLAVGALIATQAPANALLAKHSGDLAAAFASLLIATTIIGVLLLASGDVGRLQDVPGAFRPVHALGGISGAAIVYVTIVTVRPLGAGALNAALVGAQITVAAILDRLGVLGLEKTEFSLAQYAGFGLLVAGTLLVTSP